MWTLEQFIYSIAALVIVANCVACIAVLRSGLYTRSQVLLQSAVIWLVPIFGALVVALVLRSHRDQRAIGRGNGADPENWQNAQEPSHDS
jgi:Mn2+/Fe2+ NRAMP family transporter